MFKDEPLVTFRLSLTSFWSPMVLEDTGTFKMVGLFLLHLSRGWRWIRAGMCSISWHQVYLNRPRSFILWVVWNMDENFIKTGPSKTNPRDIILFTLIYIPAIQEILFSYTFGYTCGFALRYIQMEVWVTLKCDRQCASDYFLVILIMRKQNFDSRKSAWTHNTLKDSMTDQF